MDTDVNMTPSGSNQIVNVNLPNKLIQPFKGFDATSRGVINVLVLFQISLGSLYVSITTLALVKSKQQIEESRQAIIEIPEPERLLFLFYEGIIMIINGYLTTLSTRSGYLVLLIVTMAVNAAIVCFNFYKLVGTFVSPPIGYNNEISGIILLFFLEFVYYSAIIFYSIKTYSVLKLQQELLHNEIQSDPKHDDVFKFPTTIDSLPIDDSGRIRVSRQVNRFKFTISSDLSNGPKAVGIAYESDESQE